MTSSNTIPTAATEGFKDASAYDAHRPSYPAEAVETLLKNLKVKGQSDYRIVEIASGTGKFTELLAKRPEQFLIKAVEPHDTMRQKLIEKNLPAVEVMDGTATQIPVDEEWADACIAAQAFHWFATPEALQEIHRIVKPAGAFGMIWNIEEYNKPKQWEASTKWEQKLNDFILSLDDGLPRFRHLKWKEAFDQQTSHNPLSVLKDTFTGQLQRYSLPIGEDSVKWTVWLSEDDLWSRFNTLSQVAVLQGSERENAVSIFKGALSGDDVKRNEKGEIELHGVTYIAWTDRV